MSTQPWYTTLEAVRSALDVKGSPLADQQIADAIDGASRDIEHACNRVFYPQTGTRFLDWPDPQNGTSYVLWLEGNEAVSVSALTSGGTVIGPSLYNLEPADSGPPYDRIELKLSGGGSFGLSSSAQRDVAVSGVFAGAPVVDMAAGQLDAAVADAVTTTISVTDAAAVGVGSLLLLGTERLIVTGRSWAAVPGTGIAADVAASAAANTVTVDSGAVYAAGEVLLLDGEQMRVNDVAGDVLIVTRAWNGTPLATHTTGATEYRSTTLTVERGAVGTTPASHPDGAPLSRWKPPALVGQLARAQAIDTVLQEQSGYARTVGSGDNVRNASGAGLGALWARVEDAHRRYRIGVI